MPSRWGRATMRKAETIERMYLDFDGFFASVMQQEMPELRGKPVGIIPFDLKGGALHSTAVIACSKEAKAAGCKNVMRVPDAKAICPNIILVEQRPDLFRRAHNTLLNEISCEIPIETVKSIDELSCKLDTATIADPSGLARRIKERIRKNVGEYITCSMGFAANRLLAKTACKIDKPNGVTIWHPKDMPHPLLKLKLSDIPGIGKRMEQRLFSARIYSIGDLYNTQPKHMRALWSSVNGERMWYALHGYDIFAMPTGRGMYGHGRVLPPKWRNKLHAQSCTRLLLTKAARRMRRDGYYADKLQLWLDIRTGPWFGQIELHSVQDDQACLAALGKLWEKAGREVSPKAEIFRLGVTLAELSPAGQRQLDMFLHDDVERQKCEVLTNTVDRLNQKFGKRVVTLGPWIAPPGGHAGAKIAYCRIPSAEDFW
jgi:DNA polymerase-4